MSKIVYNACYGGFSLSPAAEARYFELKGVERPQDFYSGNIERTDPALVKVVEELGNKASGAYSRLAIREIPRGTAYRIDKYDGRESVITRDEDNWSIAP